MRRLLIIGCGDVARRALPWLVQRFRVYALVRDPADARSVRELGAVPLLGDLDRRESLRRLAGLAHCVLHTAPPPEHGDTDPRMRRLLAALTSRGSLPQRISYISTSGVYGNCMDERVAETRRARPATARARRRVDAEQRLRRLVARRGVAAAILRAPGIYAEDRLPLERLRRGDPVLRTEDDVFTNHIHARDLARAAALALFRGRPARAYNVSDDSELRMGEYFDLVADRFDLPRPPRVARVEARERLSPATLSFMSESRRLDNTRIKRELRFRFAYPRVADCLEAMR